MVRSQYQVICYITGIENCHGGGVLMYIAEVLKVKAPPKSPDVELLIIIIYFVYHFFIVLLALQFIFLIRFVYTYFGTIFINQFSNFFR